MKRFFTSKPTPLPATEVSAGFYYSSCWDQQRCDNPAQRSNMGFTISAGSR